MSALFAYDPLTLNATKVQRIELDRLFEHGGGDDSRVAVVVLGRTDGLRATKHVTCVLGAAPVPWILLRQTHEERKFSRFNGVFTRDASGQVRYIDAGSKYGTLLKTARGFAARVPSLVPVLLHDGDSLVLGVPEHTLVYQRTPKAVPAEEAPARAEFADVLEACSCPVCLETMHGSRILDCGHALCADCLVRWLMAKHTCPLCRAPQSVETQARGGTRCLQLDQVTTMLLARVGTVDAKSRDVQYKSHDGVLERAKASVKQSGAVLTWAVTTTTRGPERS